MPAWTSGGGGVILRGEGEIDFADKGQRVRMEVVGSSKDS